MNKISGFTLVELIVVTTILTVLGAIGFMSYSNYLVGVRDTKRLGDLVVIHDGLQSAISNGDLPIPENSVIINAGGILVGYQGYAGSGTLSTAGVQNGGKDPKNDTYYTYFLYKDMKSFELMTWFEDSPDKIKTTGYVNPVIGEAYAGTPDYSTRIPKVYGKQLGILVNSSNIPVQELMTGSLDIGTTTSVYTSYLTDSTVITGTGGVLIAGIPNGSCERINIIGNAHGDGMYRINQRGVEFDRYCKMSRMYKNKLNVNWALGSGSIGDFLVNGNNSENQRIMYTTPFGDTDIVWQAVPDGGNNADGGWNYGNVTPIDSSKTYRLSVWIQKTGDNDGTTYLGTYNVNNLDGTPNGNPYFFYSDLPELNKWYLLVAYVHKSSYTSLTSYGGIYDKTTGEKVVNLTDFKNIAGNTVLTHRTYLYYNNNTTNRQYFYNPRFEEIDPQDIGDVRDLTGLQ